MIDEGVLDERRQDLLGGALEPEVIGAGVVMRIHSDDARASASSGSVDGSGTFWPKT